MKPLYKFAFIKTYELVKYTDDKELDKICKEKNAVVERVIKE